MIGFVFIYLMVPLFEARCPDMPSGGFGEVKDHAPERKSMKACTQSAMEQIEPVVDKLTKELKVYGYFKERTAERKANSSKWNEKRNPLMHAS